MWLLKNVFDLFYPPLCYGCNEVLQKNDDILCNHCLLHLSFVPISVDTNTEMKRRFYGKLKVEHCIAVLYFSENGITQQLLHALKYKNQQKIGVFIANQGIHYLNYHEIFKWTDVIVGIPLHQSKEKERGYNQLDTFCNTLSKHYKLPYYKDFLIKTSKTKTQTHKNILQRAETKSEFKVNPKYNYLEHKNVLLVDDVMTTGSTLEIAGNCILKNTNNQISILTMAYTR